MTYIFYGILIEMLGYGELIRAVSDDTRLLIILICFISDLMLILNTSAHKKQSTYRSSEVMQY